MRRRWGSRREAKGKKASGTKTDPSFIYPLVAAHFRAGRTERRTGEGKRERTREASQRCKGYFRSCPLEEIYKKARKKHFFFLL